MTIVFFVVGWLECRWPNNNPEVRGASRKAINRHVIIIAAGIVLVGRSPAASTIVAPRWIACFVIVMSYSRLGGL